MSLHVAGNKKKKPTQNSINSIGGGSEGSSLKGKIKDQNIEENNPLHTSMEQLQMHGSTNASRRSAGSNWNRALRTLKSVTDDSTEVKMKNSVAAKVNNVRDKNESNAENSAPKTAQSKASRLRQKRKALQRNKYLAMDCEMVGVGVNGQNDILARVSIVNKRGDVLLDKFVKPRETVTDYRTSISGIRPHDIENGEDFSAVQDEVVQLLQDKILVGHAIRNDLAVLHIKHPYANIRDTSRYKPLCRLVANGRTPSLKRVCQTILGLEIQTGEHNSVEDARAAMKIYNRLSNDWEKYIEKHHHQHRIGN